MPRFNSVLDENLWQPFKKKCLEISKHAAHEHKAVEANQGTYFVDDTTFSEEETQNNIRSSGGDFYRFASLHDRLGRQHELSMDYNFPPLPTEPLPIPDVFSTAYLLEHHPELFSALSLYFSTVYIAMVVEYVDYVLYPCNVPARLYRVNVGSIKECSQLISVLQPLTIHETGSLPFAVSSLSPASSFLASAPSAFLSAQHFSLTEFQFDDLSLSSLLERGTILDVGDIVQFIQCESLTEVLGKEADPSWQAFDRQLSYLYFFVAPGKVLVRGQDPWGLRESTGVPTKISRHFRDLFLKYRGLYHRGVSGFCLRHDDEIFMRHRRFGSSDSLPYGFPEQWKFCYLDTLYVSFSSRYDASGCEIPLWYDFKTPSIEEIFSFFKLTQGMPRFNLKVSVEWKATSLDYSLRKYQDLHIRELREIGDPQHLHLSQCRRAGPNGSSSSASSAHIEFYVNLPVSLEIWFKIWLEKTYNQHECGQVGKLLIQYKSDYESTALHYANGPHWYE